MAVLLFMQPTTSQEALGRLTTFQQGRRKPTDVLSEAQTRLNIPSSEQRKVGLRGAISNTENLLKAVDPSVTGRTAGTFTSEAQRNRLVSMERQPLSEQFTEQSRALEGEESNLRDLNARALTEAQLAIGSDDTEENKLKGLYDILLNQEAIAEEKRRYEQQRIAEENARRASSAQGAFLGNLFNPKSATSTATTPSQGTRIAGNTTERQALTDVEKRTRGSEVDIISDYVETALSASRGNAYDKAKANYYNQFFRKVLPMWQGNQGLKSEIFKRFKGADKERQGVLTSLFTGSVPSSVISSNRATF